MTVAQALAVLRERGPDRAAEMVLLGEWLLAQAGLYLMLYAPFVAGVQIILYAGGIMVLFLFVIMLVNLERAQKEEQFNKQWLVGLLAAVALGACVLEKHLTLSRSTPGPDSAFSLEPHEFKALAERKKVGWRVMFFLVVLAGLLYYTKKKVWSGVAH